LFVAIYDEVFPNLSVGLSGQVRVFAIAGSAAFVGGISRMLLPITVILMEAVGNLFFFLPLALTL